jgi:mannosyltransferase
MTRSFFVKQGALREYLAVSVIVAAGALLRFYGLGARQLWLDELIQLLRFSHATWSERLTDITTEVAAVPLDYMVQYFFVSLWGGSPFMARLHAAAFGVLSLPLAYLLARKFVSVQTALWSAALLAVYPLHLYYSQEARNYSLFLFLCLVSWLLFLRAIPAVRFRSWLPFILAASLCLYTNYFAVLVLLSQSCFLGSLLAPSVRRCSPLGLDFPFKRACLFFGLSAAVTIGLFLPWLAVTLASTRHDSPDIFLEAGLFLRIFKEYSGGSYPLSLLLFMCFGLGLWRSWARRQHALLSLLAFSTVLPVLLVLTLDWYRGYYFAVRQVLFTAPFFLMGVAEGIAQKPGLLVALSSWKARGWIGVLVLFLSLGTFSLHRRTEQADWVGLIGYLKRETTARDHIVAPNIEAVIGYLFPEARGQQMGHEQLLLFTEMGDGNPFHGRLFVVQSRYMTPVQKEAIESLADSPSFNASRRYRLDGFDVVCLEGR